MRFSFGIAKINNKKKAGEMRSIKTLFKNLNLPTITFKRTLKSRNEPHTLMIKSRPIMLTKLYYLLKIIDTLDNLLPTLLKLLSCLV